jgi:trehalose utilization protein
MADVNTQPIDRYLRELAERKGTDLHITAGSPPLLRVDGQMRPVGDPALSADGAKDLIHDILTDDLWERLVRDKEVDFAFDWADAYRLRGNAFHTRAAPAMALRLIPYEIPGFAELGIPGTQLRFQGRIRHTITNRRIETIVFRLRLGRDVARPRPSARWFRPSELRGVPLSSVGLRIAGGLGIALPRGMHSVAKVARDASGRDLGGAPVDAEVRVPAPLAGAVRAVAHRLGAIPGSTQRLRTEPEPAGGRPEDGPPLGRDPRVVRPGRRCSTSRRGGMTIRVTVWNEYRQERSDPPVRAIYPDGIHAAIAAGLREHDGFEVRTATLDEPDQGLSDAVLAETDVLTWWGHVAHPEVSDEVVDRVQTRVLDGMGLIVLHAGHFSKIFKRLMGTSCDLKWREDGRRERLWVVDPSHPIAEGIGESFVLAEEEMYGEHFDIPPPDELVFVSWFEGGEVFRSGCTYRRGRGRVFYFRPGHETHPSYHDANVRRVIANAARWAADPHGARPTYGNAQPAEPRD